MVYTGTIIGSKLSPAYSTEASLTNSFWSEFTLFMCVKGKRSIQAVMCTGKGK